MDQAKTKIKRMATWTVAIFATVLAVTLAALWLFMFPQSESAVAALGNVIVAAWPILLIDLVVCTGLFVGYSAYVRRK
jgi:hypothetical protein